VDDTDKENENIRLREQHPLATIQNIVPDVVMFKISGIRASSRKRQISDSREREHALNPEIQNTKIEN
jgi:hypothetical protein